MSLLEQTFHCPLCNAHLTFERETIHCSECEYKTFYVGEIPWIFSEPLETLAEWQNRFTAYLQNISAEVTAIEVSLKDSAILESSRQRLRRLKKAKQKQSQLMRDLLKPLELSFETNRDLFKALKTTLPMSQRLMSYDSNVFRDWVWGEQENDIAVQLIKEVLPEQVDFSELVVIGAGACRLPYDLHQQLHLESTLAIDINPFLFLLAKKLIDGKDFSLMEFPLAPKSATDLVIESQFKAPAEKKQGFQFAFSDALNLSLKDGSCQVLLTPWIIDIIPQDIDIFFRQLNRVLKMGGHWLNFGSFAFLHRDPAICYSKEEVFETLEKAGFETQRQVEKEIPYLQSPYSCQKRFENVLAFSAKKVREVEEYEALTYLPEWITDSSQEIPEMDAFKSYLFINQIQFEVLRAVDGNVSIDAIAEQIMKKYRMKREQAVEAVRSFFTKIYEENLFNNL